MSLGFRLLAKLTSPAQDPDLLIKRIAAWVHQNCDGLLPKTRQGFIESNPTLFCLFHPAAEEVEISLVDPEHFTASANTSTVGPGYHIYLCPILHLLARDLGAAWHVPKEDSSEYADEAEYFFTRHENSVFDHMTAWLQTLAGSFFDGTLESDTGPTALCMSMDVQFESNELAISPLGPRDHAWLLKTSKDGYEGQDFFAWWQPGLNAAYFLGRALVQMWSNVRWRKPINDSERQLLAEVANSLNIAQKLDPSLQYPWEEWAEILEFLDANHPDLPMVRSHARGKPVIGYRRRYVSVPLPGNWRIRLPGSFSDFESDEEHNLFALDPPLEVWFTSYRFTMPSPDQTFRSRCDEIRESRSEYIREGDGFVAKAAIEEKHPETESSYYLLKSSNVCPTQRAICTIVFTESKQRELALNIWRSIEPPPQPRSDSLVS